EDRNSSTAMIVGLVPMSARVLDVGCSTGYLGEALKRERLARVWGIELDESDAEKARQRGFEQVITADLDTFAWEALDAHAFDVLRPPGGPRDGASAGGRARADPAILGVREQRRGSCLPVHRGGRP